MNEAPFKRGQIVHWGKENPIALRVLECIVMPLTKGGTRIIVTVEEVEPEASP